MVVVPVPPFAVESVPVTSERETPRDEVDICIQLFPVEPKRSDEDAMVESPVPPYAAPTEVVPTMVPLALVVRTCEGIWKSVVEPVFDIEKRDEVAKEAEDEEMLKIVLLKNPVEVVETWREKNAYGEVVPTPTRPELSMMNEVRVEEPTAN